MAEKKICDPPAVRHIPKANCANLQPVSLKTKAKSGGPNEQAGAPGHTIYIIRTKGKTEFSAFLEGMAEQILKILVSGERY